MKQIKISRRLCYVIVISFLFFCGLNVLNQESLAFYEDEPARDVETVSAIRFVDGKTSYLGGLGLDNQGKVWSWGWNGVQNTTDHGMLGIEDQYGKTSTNAYAGGMIRLPYFVENNIHIDEIEAGYHTNYALDNQGQVYSWGRGIEGQIGNGKNRARNARPINISEINGSLLKGKKIVKIVASSEWTTSVFALDDQGNVYGWGYSSDDIFPGYSGSKNQPVELKEIKQLAGNIIDISVGERHGLVLNNQGEIFVWGRNNFGQHGNGKNSGTTLEKVQWFPTNNKKVKMISSKSDINTVVTTDDEVYQFGYMISSISSNIPIEIEYELSNVGYIPIPKMIASGKLVSYIIDQHGRLWSWGNNDYFGFFLDGPYIENKRMRSNIAKIQPDNMGDGDTERYSYDIKAPIFVSKSKPTGLLQYKTYGKWSNINELHPTIYDKKYMKTVGEFSGTNKGDHSKVFPVDSEGQRLVYTIQQIDGLYQSSFLVAGDDYTGDWYLDNSATNGKALPKGLTTIKSVPEIKNSEKSWIGLAVDLNNFDYTSNHANKVPYMSSVHTFQSSSILIDKSGNLYKSALDGSGAIAWGWDIEPAYDTGYSTTNPQDGLYDLYNYELTFMRGAPRIIPGDIVINNTKDKHYLSTKKTDKIGMKIDIGMAYHDEQLNIKVEPELRQVKRIIMPYDPTSADFNNLAPTYDDFMTAYNDAQNRGYDTLDIARKNDWEGIKHEVGAPPVDHLIDESTEIKDNSVVWIMLQTHNYSNSPVTIKRLEFDNFYTESLIKSKGAMLDNPKEETYAPLPDNVVKVTKDNNKDVYGFPLDKHGHIIAEPTFGYDEVSIRRIDDTRLDELGTRPKFSQRYLWPTTQSEEKTYLLDGQDSIKNGPGDIAQKEGSLPVDETFTHTFYYEENPHIRYNLHYMAVTDEGEIISPEEFDIPSEIRMLKDEELTRKAPKLKKNEDVIPITYQVVYSKPPKTVDLNKFKELTPDKEAIFRVPVIDDITDATLIYLYEEEEKEVVLNVRQVILKDNNIALPEVGYASYRGANKDWSQQEGLNQVKMPSQILKDPVTYRPIPLIINKKVDRFSLEAVIPQYYKYIGFKQSNKDGNYDTTSIEKDKIIPVDYSDKSKEKWVTIYIEPLTDQPSNYTWQSIVNSFGEVLVK